jgi:hypothetical protein
MTINNRLLAVVLISVVWMIPAMVVISIITSLGTPAYVSTFYIGVWLLLSSAFTYGVLSMYGRRAKPKERMKARDLDRLRERLTEQEDTLFEPDQKQTLL